MKSRCLIALDCADQSLELVKYFSKMFLPEHHDAVLFHVNLQVPDSVFDAGQDIIDMSPDIPTDNWVAEKRTITKTFLEKAKQILLDAGFKPESITIKSPMLKQGIARDIITESRNGYAMLLVGRSETRFKNDTAIGSVAAKLIAACDYIPMIIVGGKPNTEKILIGFDQSDGAMYSVYFIGSILRNTNIDVTLCHVIRSLALRRVRGNNDMDYQDIFTPEHEFKWQVITENKIRPLIERAIGLLKESGWPAFRVHRKIIVDVETRSQSLVEEAYAGHHGSIVLGRRGTSLVKEFFLGRVSRKVLEKAGGHAVWII